MTAHEPVTDAGNLVGLKIRLNRPIDIDQPCCRNICIIGAGARPHAGALHCADCGQHRGWLSKSTAQWIESVMTHFGVPTTIIVRPASTIEQEEAPDTASTATP
jgi:hypothetical protein